MPPPIQVRTESVNAVVLSRLRCSEFLYVSKYVAFCIYVAFLWLRKGVFGRGVSLEELVQSWKAIIEVILELQADEYTEAFNKYKPMTLVGHQWGPPWLYERINFLSVYGQCGLNWRTASRFPSAHIPGHNLRPCMYEGNAGIPRPPWPLEVGFSDRSQQLKSCTDKYV